MDFVASHLSAQIQSESKKSQNPTWCDCEIIPMLLFDKRCDFKTGEMLHFKQLKVYM